MQYCHFSELTFPVDYSDFPFKDWYRIFVEQNVDALQVMLDELEACGLRTWVEEELVDALVPTLRWRCSDSGIPVKEWKALVGSKQIAIFPGVETLNLNDSSTRADQIKGYAAAWFAEHADRIYTFNFVGCPEYEQRTQPLSIAHKPSPMLLYNKPKYVKSP